MPTPDGRIGSRDICTGAAVERVIADGGVTSLKISATLQSDNYSAGSAGWQINRVTGSCEFQDATIRGSLNASDITTGTLTTSVLANGSIGMGKIEVQAALVTNQYIQSSSFSSGSSGWRIRADGTAEFQDAVIRGSLNASDIGAGEMSADYLGAGTIGVNAIYLANSGSSFIASNNGSDWYIRGNGEAQFTNVYISGTLATNSVTGWLTTGSGGGFRTGTSGDYIEIADSTPDRIYFYTSAGQPGRIQCFSETMQIYAPGLGAYVTLFGGTGNVTISAGSSVFASTSLLYTNGRFETGNGSGGSPSHSFLNDPTIGMFLYSSGTIGFAGTGYFTGALRVANILYVDSYIRGEGGNVSAPGFSFEAATTSGMYTYAGFTGVSHAGNAVVVGNGVNELYLGGMTSNAGDGTLRYIGSQVYYFASSARFKHDIHPAAQDLDPDSLLDWEPVWYRFNDNPEDRQLGFIAEQVHEASGEYLVKRDADGLIHNNDEDAMRVLMVEKLKDLDARLRALEGAAA